MEAIVVLVPAPDFKSGGGRGDTSSAGSIPVRFRQTEFGFADSAVTCLAQNHTGTTISDFLWTLGVASVRREDATELEHDRFEPPRSVAAAATARSPKPGSESRFTRASKKE